MPIKVVQTIQFTRVTVTVDPDCELTGGTLLCCIVVPVTT